MQILNFMGNSNKRLLVHKNMERVTVNENIDIILTPQFYTFLREELAIKFAYQAKNIAPSLFDDYLETSIEYQYHVYKCGEDWCFFAYKINEIVLFLQEKGLLTHNIGKIYFAQELAPNLNKPIQLGDFEVLQTIDNTVTILPQRLMGSEEPYQTLDFSKPVLQNGIAISSSLESVIPIKQTVLLTVLLLFLGASFIVEGNRIKSSIEGIEEQQEQLLAQNPKLGSSLIRNSELSKYEPLDQKEREKRETIAQIAKVLSAESKLKALTVNEKNLIITIEAKSTAITKQLEKHAKTKNLKIKSIDKNIVTMEKNL